MKRMLQLVFGLLALVFPLSARAQVRGDTIKIDSLDVRGYKLSSSNPEQLDKFTNLVNSKMASNVLVHVEGHTDATGFRHCKGDSLCNAEANASLEMRRARDYRNALVARGVPAGRVVAFAGQPSHVRGAEFRGVTIYILEITTPVSVAARPVVTTTGPDTALARRVAELERKNAELQNELGALKNWLNKVADRTNSSAESPKEEKEPFVSIDLGTSLVGAKTGHVDTFVPAIGFYAKPRGSPVEVVFTAGLRPSPNSNICNRADVFMALDFSAKVWDLGGPSVGLSTPREGCTNGGPRYNERFLTRNLNLTAGHKFMIPLGRRDLRLTIDPALTWGQTNFAQTHSVTHGFGWQLGIGIRTTNNHKPD